jgi:hypothetical protein
LGDEDVRSDGDFGAGLATGWMHLNHSPFDLAVVVVDPGVLERIPDAFLKVVPVAPSRIGWKQVELNFKLARKRLADPPREE